MPGFLPVQPNYSVKPYLFMVDRLSETVLETTFILLVTTKMSPTHKTKDLSYIFYFKFIRVDVRHDIRYVGDKNIDDTFSIMIQ